MKSRHFQKSGPKSLAIFKIQTPQNIMTYFYSITVNRGSFDLDFQGVHEPETPVTDDNSLWQLRKELAQKHTFPISSHVNFNSLSVIHS